MKCFLCGSEDCVCSDSERKEVIREYYEPLLEQGSHDHERLGWESRQAQHSRFDIMLDTVGFNGMSLLDVGCGLGNLMDALKKRNWNVRYSGVDLLPQMIGQAEQNHPDMEWICCDIFKENHFEEKSFDVVYSSGIFNLDLGNNLDFLIKAIRKFQTLARSHICFNLLSDHSDDKEEGYYYYSACQVRKYLTEHLLMGEEKISIVSAYLHNDMTIVIDL